jgi:hypothetical protein
MLCHHALAETLHAYIKADWERQVAEILDQHNEVRALVKNDRLGLAIAYRKEGLSKNISQISLSR